MHHSARLLHMVLELLPLDGPRQVANVHSKAALRLGGRRGLRLSIFTDKDLAATQLRVIERGNGILRCFLRLVRHDSASLQSDSSLNLNVHSVEHVHPVKKHLGATVPLEHRNMLHRSRRLHVLLQILRLDAPR